MKQPNAAEFADIALAMHDEPDVDRTIERVVDYARDATASDDGGLLLLRGRQRVEIAGATDPRVEKSDHLQADIGEGPGLRTLHGQQTAVVDDTQADARWPRWAESAARLGLRSALSVRLSTTHSTLGALNLYARQPSRFDEDDVAVAQTFARYASLALADAREESGLRLAVEARHVIGQAQGILMERFGLDSDQAFAVLRRYSRDNNIKLRTVAHQIIQTRRMPESS